MKQLLKCTCLLVLVAFGSCGRTPESATPRSSAAVRSGMGAESRSSIAGRFGNWRFVGFALEVDGTYSTTLCTGVLAGAGCAVVEGRSQGTWELQGETVLLNPDVESVRESASLRGAYASLHADGLLLVAQGREFVLRRHE